MKMKKEINLKTWNKKIRTKIKYIYKDRKFEKIMKILT